MRYAAYIEIEGPNRLQKIEETLNWALYDLLKRDPGSPSFDVQVHVVPSSDELQAGHLNTLTAVAQRERK